MPKGMTRKEATAPPGGLLRRLFHGSAEGLLAARPDTGRVLDVNDAFLGLLGRSREDVIGATADELGLFREPLAGRLATEVVPGVGGDDDVLLVSEIAPGAEAATLRDLHAAEERFKALVEQIPAITYTERSDPTSPTGTRTTYISPQAAHILGYTAEELLDDDLWAAITHPDDFPGVHAEEARVDARGEPFLMEYRVIDKAGNAHWFRDESVLLRDEDTGVKMWQGLMLDITEQREAAQQLHQAQARYQSLVETLPAVVFVDALDERSTNLYTSPQSEAILGYTAQDWADDPDLWMKILHPEDRERILGYLNDPDGGWTVWDQENRIVAKDGRPVWVREVAQRIKGLGGETVAQGFLLDITGQKVAEKALKEALEREHDAAEQLRALDGLKNTLLHALSHDLKSPLTAILGAASTLGNPDLHLGEEERREFLRRITDRTIRMDRLLSDVLDLERLDRGLVEPDRASTDLAALCRSVGEHCDGLRDRPFTVTGNVTASVGPAKVERIVDNLLANACRHTPAGRPVEIVLAAACGGVEVAVLARGPGVPAELKTAVFEAFRQGEAAAGGEAGMGIGLSLVARFAELHTGRAWVEDRPGGGAIFKVFLPE